MPPVELGKGDGPAGQSIQAGAVIRSGEADGQAPVSRHDVKAW